MSGCKREGLVVPSHVLAELGGIGTVGPYSSEAVGVTIAVPATDAELRCSPRRRGAVKRRKERARLALRTIYSIDQQTSLFLSSQGFASFWPP
jgi:hypothetical protein